MLGLPLSQRVAHIIKSYGLGLSLLVIALVAVAVPHASHATLQSSDHLTVKKKRSAPEFVPGEILVRFRDGVVNKKAQSFATTLSVSGDDIPMSVEKFDNTEVLSGLRKARVAPENTLQAIQALNARPDVLYAEPNYILHKEAVPNDPQYSNMYGLKKVGLESAWNTTIGSRNIVVGVVDEGIDINHPDLKDNIWKNPGEIPGNGIDDDGNGFVDDVNGWDFYHNDNTVFDGATDSTNQTDAHGTHVSGTIGASGNNGIGVVGVNWQVSIMSLKFLGPTDGSDADAIRAINYAKMMRDLWVTTNGAKGANVRVLSNSYGGGGFSQAFLDTIKAAGDSGILFVAAAGNDAADNDESPHYPSSFDAPNLISVASSNSLDQLSSFSNFGATSVHVAAPGSGILSTTPNNTYSVFSGTSMATPHVSGAAALVLSQFPNLSVQRLRSLLIYNGDVLPALATKDFSGSRLNVSQALQVAATNDTTPPGTVANFRVDAQNGRSVMLKWTASGDDGSAGRASLYELNFTDAKTGAKSLLARLRSEVSGTEQSLAFNIPYGHTSGAFNLREFDKVGNEGTPASVNVTVDASINDPLRINLSAPGALTSGGSPMGFNADDKYQTYTLPFAFPFFGQTQNSVTVATNGVLYFSTPPTRANGDSNNSTPSISDLTRSKMIAGMWEDLDLRTCFRPDADVYVVQPSPGRIIFRWQGISFIAENCPSGSPTDPNKFINFEIELQNNGTIITRYGDGNRDLLPVVGVSGGEPDAYVVTTHTSTNAPLNLMNARTVTFSSLPDCHFSISPTDLSLGSNAQSGTINITAGSNCNWLAVNNAGWVTINSTALGTGSAALNYSVAANTTNLPRVGTIIVAGQTFTVTQAAGPPPVQPADDALFFVRQHYLDFLEREPDVDGEGYWSDQILRCGTDATCINDRRIGVSAAFFIELEFQQTGSYVYRVYRGTLARNPTFAEFMPDRRQVIGGANLDASKAAFTLAFVQRPEFFNNYISYQTAGTFVDGLLLTIRKTTNVDLTVQRASLIDLYNTGGSQDQSRARVVQAAAESAAFQQSVYNEAFVLMQYFGYLRRDPESDGFKFWLNVLNNQEPNNYRGMVCSFLTSAEYQVRFGSAVTRTNHDCSTIH